MFKRSKRVFILILVLAAILVIVDLPRSYHLKFNLFGKNIDQTINPPKTHLGLDLAGGTHVVLEANMSDVPEEERKSALESGREVIERRVNFFGVSEPVVQTAYGKETYRIIVELPGVGDVDNAVAIIGQTAKLEFREFKETEATLAAVLVPTLDNTISVDISGSDLKKAQLTYSQQTGEPEVSIEFTSEGAKKFASVTERLVGKSLAMFLDDQPLMAPAPTVQSPITDGIGVITGNFTTDEARTLALQLNAGALPVPITVASKRTVAPSLGQESIALSVRAGAIGLVMVAAFMIAQYGFLGLIADLALVLYGLIVFAIIRLIPITLTLPGIAGFILSIGMAVDSNILIFERFKEELRAGKPSRMAMELGFGRAWDSIRDANLTTILTALVLYNPGNWQFLPSSGLVRGFAATLLLGVLVSLFTGIVVTRTFIRVLYKK